MIVEQLHKKYGGEFCPIDNYLRILDDSGGWLRVWGCTHYMFSACYVIAGEGGDIKQMSVTDDEDFEDIVRLYVAGDHELLDWYLYDV